MKFLFHFAKTAIKFDEWIEFGSPRIFTLNSKVVLVKRERKPKKIETEMSAKKQLSAAAATISREVLQTKAQIFDVFSAADDEHDKPLRQVSEASDEQESEHVDPCATVVKREVVYLEPLAAGPVVYDHDRGLHKQQNVSYSIADEWEVDRQANIGSIPFTSNVWHSEKMLEPSYVAHRPFVEASRASSTSFKTMTTTSEALAPHNSCPSTDDTAAHVGGRTKSAAVCERSLSHLSRPPNFSFGFGSQQHQQQRTDSLLSETGPESAPTNAPQEFGLSGLDMLAAVTKLHSFGTSIDSIDEASGTAEPASRTGNFVVLPNGFGHSSTLLQSDSAQTVALLQQRLGLQQQQQQRRDPSSFGSNSTNSGSSSSNQQSGWAGNFPT